jgi:hypothetical protein
MNKPGNINPGLSKIEQKAVQNLYILYSKILVIEFYNVDLFMIILIGIHIVNFNGKRTQCLKNTCC